MTTAQKLRMLRSANPEIYRAVLAILDAFLAAEETPPKKPRRPR